MTNGAESMKIIYPLRYKYALMTCQVTECTLIYYLTWCKIIINDNNTTTTTVNKKKKEEKKKTQI